MTFLTRSKNQKYTFCDAIFLSITAIIVFAVTFVLLNPKFSGISNKSGRLVFIYILLVVVSGGYIFDYEKNKSTKIKIIRFVAITVWLSFGIATLGIIGHFKWIEFPATAPVNFLYCFPFVILGEAVKNFVERTMKRYESKQSQQK